jgi:hypothetical protein
MQALHDAVMSVTAHPLEPSSFQDALGQYFPGSYSSEHSIHRSLQILRPFGFEPNNTMACASFCRDELTRPFANNLNESWHSLFNFSSLAGMLYLGVTGFKAAHHHAPKLTARNAIFILPFLILESMDMGYMGTVGAPVGMTCPKPAEHS